MTPWTHATISDPEPRRELGAARRVRFSPDTAGEEGWLVLVERGASWPPVLTELLVAATVVIVAEQQGESRTSLVGRILRAGNKFPDHVKRRNGLIVQRGGPSDVSPQVCEALRRAVGEQLAITVLRSASQYARAPARAQPNDSSNAGGESARSTRCPDRKVQQAPPAHGGAARSSS